MVKTNKQKQKAIMQMADYINSGKNGMCVNCCQWFVICDEEIENYILILMGIDQLNYFKLFDMWR